MPFFVDELNKRKKKNVRPHVIGPEHLSSSVAQPHSHHLINTGMASDRVTEEGFVILDTTAVVYTELAKVN